ncbi:MAG TPA: lipid-A-disaccharide synthase [Thermosynechococcaceae cyanobacterium]
MKRRIFISTGEVSGDLQGSLLVQALERQAQQQGMELEILALGGDRMAAAGAKLLGHTSAIGSIGILESLPYVLPTLQVQRRAKQHLKQHPPDLVVLIDYMSPNIAFCNYLSKNLPAVPVVFYIAPQEWIWSLNSYNTNSIIRATARILAIFPEEAKYYQGKGGSVVWVGHPLVDRLQTAPDRASARQSLGIPAEQTAVVLLPASRQQELKYLLPVMFESARQIQAQQPQVHFWIPLAMEKYRDTIAQGVQDYGLQATILEDTAPKVGAPDQPEVSLALQAIAAADLAITKSGTVNLEIALLNVPQVVLYKVNPLTAWIMDKVLKFSIPFVSPPNLVQMKPIVREFLQDNATPANITEESLKLLCNSDYRQQMLSGYQEMRQAIGEPGVCDRAAQEILGLMTDSPSAESHSL